MQYQAYITYKNERKIYEVEANSFYDAQIEAARLYLEETPQKRPHDDKRRPYDIPVRPYWLVINGYVHLMVKEDRRIRS